MTFLLPDGVGSVRVLPDNFLNAGLFYCLFISKIESCLYRKGHPGLCFRISMGYNKLLNIKSISRFDVCPASAAMLRGCRGVSVERWYPCFVRVRLARSKK